MLPYCPALLSFCSVTRYYCYTLGKSMMNGDLLRHRIALKQFVRFHTMKASLSVRNASAIAALSLRNISVSLYL